MLLETWVSTFEFRHIWINSNFILLKYFRWCLMSCMSFEINKWSFSCSTSDKKLACQCRSFKRCGFKPWVTKISWRMAWQPSPVFFLENHLDREAWRATVCWDAKSRTWMKRLCTHTHVNIWRAFSSKFKLIIWNCIRTFRNNTVISLYKEDLQ